MCGICGILDFRGRPVRQAALTSMVDAIAHRGPDGKGVYVDGPLGLGHCRLAIIDLSNNAAQPMTTPDGRYSISYNGEIFNFQALRCELEWAGVAFKSHSDTEVVLSAYAAWGPACIARFNGMFAMAIWDSREKVLLLARDRYGIKPLYYAHVDDKLIFASEQKALLRHADIQRDLDLEGIYEYFTFQNIFTDKTFFKNIKTFPAGEFALVRLDGDGRVQWKHYWDFDFQEPTTTWTFERYADELAHLFGQAVQRQLVSDVEIGTFLSGGVDSGAVTAVAADHFPCIKSFTCGFDLSSASGLELNFDERAQAERLSYLLKTEHYEMVLKAGDMERCLPQMVWHMEEPRVGQSYPNFYACKLASSFGKVVLAGTGGDELFGGYPWRYFEAPQSTALADYVDRYYLYWQRLVPNSVLKRLFQPVWNDVRHVWTRDIFQSVFDGREMTFDTPEARVNHSLYLEAKTFLHGLLSVEDKLSMAHGLEVRVPFLDNDLVDFACRVPVRFKLGEKALGARIDENAVGKQHAFQKQYRNGKRLLRQALSRFLPENACNGIKQGFSGPDASWFKGESINYVRSIVDCDSANIYALMDPVTVREQVELHLSGKANKRLFIWSLLYLEEWLKAYG